jgi:peptidoglycan/LPS O-acetylase OafA/YrhL
MVDAATGKRPYYSAIDGVRAICVLLVMLNHLKIGNVALEYVHGYIGVDIFFVISGFLITDLLIIEEKKRGRIDLQAFYLRRAFRILPIYSVVLLIYIAVCQLPSQAEKWVQLKGGLPYFLLFLNEFVQEPNGGTVFGQTWSLGVEEKFYLVWPVAFFILFKGFQKRFFVVAALFSLTGVLPFVLSKSYSFMLAKSYYGLLAGCVMAIVLTSGYAASYSEYLRRIPSGAMAALLALGLGLELWNQKFTFLLTWIIVIFLSYVIVKQTWISAFLSLKPMIWLGRRSYSMYLVHVLVMNAFERYMPLANPWQATLFIGVVYLVSALVAHVLFTVIEEPARVYGKSFIKRISQPA